MQRAEEHKELRRTLPQKKPFLGNEDKQFGKVRKNWVVSPGSFFKETKAKSTCNCMLPGFELQVSKMPMIALMVAVLVRGKDFFL